MLYIIHVSGSQTLKIFGKKIVLEPHIPSVARKYHYPIHMCIWTPPTTDHVLSAHVHDLAQCIGIKVVNRLMRAELLDTAAQCRVYVLYRALVHSAFIISSN